MGWVEEDSLEGEEGSTHLYCTTEGHLAISLAEVHVSHAQVSSLDKHWEVHLSATNTLFSQYGISHRRSLQGRAQQDVVCQQMQALIITSCACYF